MKTITIRLTDDEERMVKLVTSKSKYREFRDPKAVYMNTIIRALSNS